MGHVRIRRGTTERAVHWLDGQTETAASHPFQLLQQSSRDEMRFSAQDPEASQKALDETWSSDYRSTAVLKLPETLLPVIQ